MIRTDCWNVLRYGGRWFCKAPWRSSPGTDPKPLDLGCPKDCKEYVGCGWKHHPADTPVNDDAGGEDTKT